MLSELNRLAEEFSSLPDSFSRYAYLVELAVLLPAPAEGLCTEENRFHGCQSNVWLRAGVSNGVCHIDAYSDTLILRGILYLYRAILDGEDAEAVLNARFDFLHALAIGEHFSRQRTAGIVGLLSAIQSGVKRYEL